MNEIMFSKEECLHDISALETESGYHAYVKRLLNYADCFYLTFMASETEESMEDFKGSIWSELYDSIIDINDTGKYSTSNTYGIVIFFQINHVTSSFLMKKKDIYDFTKPMVKKDYFYLWDLGFVKNDEIFFSTISHERECFVRKKEAELLLQCVKVMKK